MPKLQKVNSAGKPLPRGALRDQTVGKDAGSRPLVTRTPDRAGRGLYPRPRGQGP
jgi:hypothetical protein